MAVLLVIVPDFLVCERFVGFCEFHEVVVETFNCLIPRWVGSDLVRMEFEGESFVVLFYSVFTRALRVVLLAGPGAKIKSRTLQLTRETPRMSYGSQIFGTVRAVTMIR